MDKHTTTHHDKDSKDAKAGEEFRDSLGQANPAHDLEKKNIADVKTRQDEADKEAKKAEKAEK
jgi:hypothetical protein